MGTQPKTKKKEMIIIEYLKSALLWYTVLNIFSFFLLPFMAYMSYDNTVEDICAMKGYEASNIELTENNGFNWVLWADFDFEYGTCEKWVDGKGIVSQRIEKEEYDAWVEYQQRVN